MSLQKRARYRSRIVHGAALLACMFVCLLSVVSVASAAVRNARLAKVHTFAFGIGDGALSGNVPARFRSYDLVIIDGEAATSDQVAALHAQGSIVLAYLDVGTIERGRGWFRRVAPYRLDLWDDWGEWYADVAAPGFRRVITGRVAPQMLAKGFDGLFLDNADMVETHAAQRVGMRRLIGRLAAMVHARSGLLFAQNGDDSVGAIATLLDGWNREDVTATYDFTSHRYVHQSATDTRAAQEMLRRMSGLGLLTTATDYTSSRASSLARESVSNACSAGAISFVSDIGLSRMPPVAPRCP